MFGAVDCLQFSGVHFCAMVCYGCVVLCCSIFSVLYCSQVLCESNVAVLAAGCHVLRYSAHRGDGIVHIVWLDST